MGQNMFDASFGTLGFGAAGRVGNEAPARLAAIDTGPYLRQVGRQLTRDRASEDMHRNILRIRAKYGLVNPASVISRAESARRVQPRALRPVSGVTVWISWLTRRVRLPV